MASDDEEIEQIDDELARVEEEIRELEEEEDLPEPEAPEPGAGAVDAPEPEEAFEGEPDVEEDEGFVSRLTSRFRSPETEDDEEAEDEADTEDADEDQDDGGLIGGLIGSDDEDDEEAEEDLDVEGTDDETTEEEIAEDEAPGDGQTLEREPDEDEAGQQVGSDTADEPGEDDEEPPHEDLEAEQAAEETEEEAAEDDDQGFLAGLTGRFGSEDDEETEEDEAGTEETDTEEDEDDADGFLGVLIGSDDEDDEGGSAEEEPDDEDLEAEDDEEDDGFLAGLIGSDDEDEEPDDEEPAEDPDASDADDEAPPSANEGDRDPDQEDPPEDASEDEDEEPDDESEDPDEDDGDEENRKRAAALLARFQDEDDDPEGGQPPGDPPEDDEEDEDRRRGVIVGAAVVVLLLAVAAVAAFLYLGDGGAGASDSLEPNLVADSFQNEEGSYVAVTGDAVRFDASASQGSVTEYRWAFGDGQTETTSDATVEHAYPSAGSYTVELTLVGSDEQAQTTLPVVVLEAPQAQPELLVGGEPVAEAGTVGNNAFVGQSVTLDGSGSTADPEHTLTSYAWDTNGDGSPEATGREAEVSFDRAGRWLVDLTVKDDLGNEDNRTQVLHVSRSVVHNDTIGPSGTQPAMQSFNASVVEGRLAAQPVQLELRLTYNSSSDGTGGLPVQPEVQSDLDLNVTSPDGTGFAAEDDSGQGNESLTLPQADLDPLGSWNATVIQDTQESPTGSTNEVQFELVIETIY